MDASVVIPTHQRPEALRRCLEALAGQTLAADRFQVIACDDGSDHPGYQDLAGQTFPFAFELLRLEKRGPAHARNRGLEKAAAPLVLFLNDDALPAPDLLERHLAAHAGHSGRDLAVLGSFDLAGGHAASPLGSVLARTTALFGYAGMEAGREYGHDHFYTCNLSLPCSRVLQAGGFDEEFAGPAAEDIELGYRLCKDGLAVLYRPDCAATHDHAMTPEGFCRLGELRGSWAPLFFAKHPDLAKAPDLSPGAVVELAAWLTQYEEAAHSARRDLEAMEAAFAAGQEPAAGALLLVNLLHQYHYRKGLAESPFLARCQTARQEAASYDQEAGRALA